MLSFFQSDMLRLFSGRAEPLNFTSRSPPAKTSRRSSVHQDWARVTMPFSSRVAVISASLCAMRGPGCQSAESVGSRTRPRSRAVWERPDSGEAARWRDSIIESVWEGRGGVCTAVQTGDHSPSPFVLESPLVVGGSGILHDFPRPFPSKTCERMSLPSSDLIIFVLIKRTK